VTNSFDKDNSDFSQKMEIHLKRVMQDIIFKQENARIACGSVRSLDIKSPAYDKMPDDLESSNISL
jgi:hypothetical protein